MILRGVRVVLVARAYEMKKLFSQEQIAERVQALAQEIMAGCDRSCPLVVVGVLKGAAIFMADLVRALSEFDVRCDFLRVASYGEDGIPTGQVRLEFDLTQPIRDMAVLLVEDIVDTGSTLAFLKRHLLLQQPRELKICALFYKPVNLEVRQELDFVGFEISTVYVVGYGMDLGGRYRQLPDVWSMDFQDVGETMWL